MNEKCINTFITKPAATVIPVSLNIKRPNSRIFLYSSRHIGRLVSIVTIAAIPLSKQRGFFFTTSPETLLTWEFSFLIITGSTKLNRCSVICFKIIRIIHFWIHNLRPGLVKICIWNFQDIMQVYSFVYIFFGTFPLKPPKIHFVCLKFSEKVFYIIINNAKLIFILYISCCKTT